MKVFDLIVTFIVQHCQEINAEAVRYLFLAQLREIQNSKIDMMEHWRVESIGC